jgi:hypothetical protein
MSKIWTVIALLGIVVALYLSVIKPVVDKTKSTGAKSFETVKNMETNIVP